jgi:hypothetical protein
MGDVDLAALATAELALASLTSDVAHVDVIERRERVRALAEQLFAAAAAISRATQIARAACAQRKQPPKDPS